MNNQSQRRSWIHVCFSSKEAAWVENVLHRIQRTHRSYEISFEFCFEVKKIDVLRDDSKACFGSAEPLCLTCEQGHGHGHGPITVTVTVTVTVTGYLF